MADYLVEHSVATMVVLTVESKVELLVVNLAAWMACWTGVSMAA